MPRSLLFRCSENIAQNLDLILSRLFLRLRKPVPRVLLRQCAHPINVHLVRLYQTLGDHAFHDALVKVRAIACVIHATAAIKPVVAVNRCVVIARASQAKEQARLICVLLFSKWVLTESATVATEHRNYRLSANFAMLNGNATARRRGNIYRPVLGKRTQSTYVVAHCLQFLLAHGITTMPFIQGTTVTAIPWIELRLW